MSSTLVPIQQSNSIQPFAIAEKAVGSPRPSTDWDA